MDYKKVAINIAIITLIITAGATTVYAYGDIENPLEYRSRGGMRGRGHFNQGHNQAVLDAIENKDYDAWKNAIGNNNPLTKVVTKDNFEKFIQARFLARNGKYDEALALSEELGINLNKKFDEFDRGRCGNQKEREDLKTMDEARAALDANDYNSWKKAVQGIKPISGKITQENFGKLIESHKLMQAGKFAEASAIRESLGLKIGRRNE